MRVATWNVNGLRARLDFVLPLAARAAARRGRHPGAQARGRASSRTPSCAALGYHVGGLRPDGAGTASRSSRARRSRWCSAACPARRSSARACSPRDVGELEFTTVYCPNGKYVGHEDFPRKLAWLDALAEHVAGRARPARARGRAAATSTSARDRSTAGTRRGSAAHIFHTDEERSRFARLLDGGLVDVFRELPSRHAGVLVVGLSRRRLPQERRAAHRLPARDPRCGRARATAVEIDREYRKKKDGLIASDHAPVIVDLGV